MRETIADRELETWAVVDLSASLDFGTADCQKRDLAIAGLAARRASPEEIADMTRILDEQSAEVAAGRTGLAQDAAFHQALALSTSLLRVHDELSKIGRETMGGEEGSDTIIASAAITEPEPAIA